MANNHAMSEETRKGGGNAPTPQNSCTSRHNESGSECKGTYYFTCPQGAEAVEGLKRLMRNCWESARAHAMRGNVLAGKSFRDALKSAARKRRPRPLYRSMWYEGQIAMLFADTNQGKTILATQIAVDLARQGRRVLYCDFEMTEEQQLLRMSREVVGEERERYLTMFERGEALPPLVAVSEDGGGGRTVSEMYDLPETLFRVEPNGMGGDDEMRRGDDGVVASEVIRSIEQWAEEFNADVVIVDNITYMALGLEKSAIATQLVQELKRLQKRRGWSMLVLAHTPKRNASEPLTNDSMAGSKKLVGAADSAFAIGCSVKDSGVKYIKQTKSRDAAFEYGADNVITCEIEKEGGLFLKLKETGYAREADLLREPTEKQAAAADEKLAALVADGCSSAQVAKELGISQPTAWRRIKALQRKPDPTVFDAVNLDDEDDDDDM